MAARQLRDLPLRRLGGALLAAASLATGAQATATARTADLTVASGGSARRYRLHVPPGAGGEALPLVIAFHGAGATTRQQERASGLSALADRERFVVAYPEGERRRWPTSGAAAAEDMRFVRALIADVARRTPIDARRVYAAGISNGGAMASRVGCELSDAVAAVASVAGAHPLRDDCRPGRPVPVLALHGLADRSVPPDGSPGVARFAPVASWAAGWAARNGCVGAAGVARTAPGVTTHAWRSCAEGAEVVLHLLDGVGHRWPSDASPAIWAFFRGRRTP